MPSRRNSIFAVKWILCLNIPNTNFHLSSVQLNCSVSSYHNLYVKFKFITLSLDRVFSISIYKGIYNLLKFIHAWLIGIFLAESLLFQVLTSWFFFFFFTFHFVSTSYLVYTLTQTRALKTAGGAHVFS